LKCKGQLLAVEDDIREDAAHALEIMEEEREYHVLYAENVEE